MLGCEIRLIVLSWWLWRMLHFFGSCIDTFLNNSEQVYGFAEVLVYITTNIFMISSLRAFCSSNEIPSSPGDFLIFSAHPAASSPMICASVVHFAVLFAAGWRLDPSSLISACCLPSMSFVCTFRLCLRLAWIFNTTMSACCRLCHYPIHIGSFLINPLPCFFPCSSSCSFSCTGVFVLLTWFILFCFAEFQFSYFIGTYFEGVIA